MREKLIQVKNETDIETIADRISGVIRDVFETSENQMKLKFIKENEINWDSVQSDLHLIIEDIVEEITVVRF